MPCVLCSVVLTVPTAHCTLYTVLALCSVQCVVHTLYNIQYAVCTVHTAHYSVYTTHCTMCSAHGILYQLKLTAARLKRVPRSGLD